MPEPQAPGNKVGNPTPCEINSNISCDNYDRAGLLLGDSIRTTVNTIKSAGAWASEKANQIYQDYKNDIQK